MPRPDHLLPPLTKDDYAAIGRVAMEWTALEQFVSYAVGALLGVPFMVGKIITANVQYSNSCDMLESLLQTRFTYKPDDLRQIHKIMNDLNEDKPNHDDVSKRKSVRTRRNEIIHGSWILAADPPKIFTVTYKVKHKVRSVVTLHDAQKVDDLADEISELTGQLWSALQPLLTLWEELSARQNGS